MGEQIINYSLFIYLFIKKFGDSSIKMAECKSLLAHCHVSIQYGPWSQMPYKDSTNRYTAHALDNDWYLTGRPPRKTMRSYNITWYIWICISDLDYTNARFADVEEVLETRLDGAWRHRRLRADWTRSGWTGGGSGSTTWRTDGQVQGRAGSITCLPHVTLHIDKKRCTRRNLTTA